VVNEVNLSAVLSDFASTLATDFPIHAILDTLVERIVGVLPVTAAGVTLMSAGAAPHYVAASDEAALRYEKLQSELGEGPSTLAFELGEAISTPDLRKEVRFPRFTAAAVAAGLGAVFTFPLRHGDGRLGALDLYRSTTGPLRAHDMNAAQTLADVTTAYLLNARAREEARSTADRFRHLALHDDLTGLPNRMLVHERIEHAAQRARRSHANAAILFVDLDRFKQVNDVYGHAAGDELLVSVARRLSALVRPGDTLARVSGDEFVFLCEDLSSADDVEVLAHRLHGAFSAPFDLTTAEVPVSASIGMAFAGPGEEISKRLVAEADFAMYQAKRRRSGARRILDLREDVKLGDVGTLERDLRTALANENLQVAYQPIVDSRDGAVVGVEALLRWTHPQRGPVAPMSMVEVAEQSSLIRDIGAWVLSRSCRDRSRWMQAHPGARLDVAVNVSARQLMGADFTATVAKALVATGMEPSALVLEVTESIFIEDTDRAMAVLDELKSLGVRLALDDFGTGYSSLGYLRRLPIDIVKIDRSFIADIGHAAQGGAIVAAVTALAHTLGLTVVAEGVESRRQRDDVRAIGCELAQGYFYARPMSADAIGVHLDAAGGGPVHLPAPPSATAG